MFQDTDIDPSVCQGIVFDKSLFDYAELIDNEMEATGLPCPNPVSRIDELGLPWCEDCEYRGEFLEWGLAHNFPALEAKENGRVVYAVAEGVYYWIVTALYATEDRVSLLYAATGEYHELEIAS